MKRVYLYVITWLVAFAASGQIHLQPTIPTSGIIPKSQLWNLVIVNATVGQVTGQLKLIVTDRGTGEQLLSASSAEVIFQKGTTAVSTAQLNPILYNYTGLPSSAINADLLPVGNYSACYSFFRISE